MGRIVEDDIEEVNRGQTVKGLVSYSQHWNVILSVIGSHQSDFKQEIEMIPFEREHCGF